MKVLLLMLAGVPFAMAAANEPAAAALGFLEKIRLGTVDLAPGKDTALSASTIAEKRHEISRRLERMADDLGKGSLEAGEVKVDGDLAAVLIRNTGSFDPSRMRVFAVGLVKVKEQWIPAPLPASFENTGIGLIAGVRRRMDSLENWMLRQQVTDLEQLREQSVTQMQRTIRTSLDPEILRSGSQQEVAGKFLVACAKRDLPAMLGFLGGLQDSLPDDWPDRLRAADQAVNREKPVGWPWRLLIAPEVIRVPVEEETSSDDAPVSFGCLDPADRAGKPAKLEMVHLNISKDENGLWRIDPPARFFHADEEEEDEDADQELRENFPSQLRNQIPAAPAATLPEAAAQLEKALLTDHPQPLIALLDLDGDPFDAISGCARAAQAWWQLHSISKPRHPVMLGFHESDGSAIVCFQFVSPREPDRPELKSFYFHQSASGWLMLPGLIPSNTPTDSEIAVKTWADEQTKNWRKNWQSKLIADDRQLDSIPAGNAPSVDQARELVGDWLAATRRKDTGAALALTAVTDRPGSVSRLLRNLGYELGAPAREAGELISGIERGDTWTVVAVKAPEKDPDAAPLYLAVNTPAGPRLLIETDLFISASGGRELLNKAALSRVKDFATPPVFDELDRLFQQFQSGLRK